MWVKCFHIRREGWDKLRKIEGIQTTVSVQGEAAETEQVSGQKQ